MGRAAIAVSVRPRLRRRVPWVRHCLRVRVSDADTRRLVLRNERDVRFAGGGAAGDVHGDGRVHAANIEVLRIAAGFAENRRLGAAAGRMGVSGDSDRLRSGPRHAAACQWVRVEQAGPRSDTVRLPDRPSLSSLAAIHFLWTTTAIAVAITMQLSTLLSLLGTRCRNEGSVGFFGAIVVLFSFMLTTVRQTLDSMGQHLLSDWIGGVVPQSLAINWGYGDLDGSTYTDLELASLITGPLLVSLLLTLVLAMWFTRCYGCRVNASAQPAKPRRRWWPRVAMPALLTRFRFRWPGRFAALTWLNARQSVPLCLAGLAIAVLIATMQLFEEGSRKTLAGELPSTT